MLRFFQYLLILLVMPLSPDAESTADSHAGRVVTSIQISVVHDGITREYNYTDSQSMEDILTYLRLLKPQAAATIDPDTFRSDFYRITLHYSDNSSTVYQQISGDYLQKNSGSWRRIAPDADLQFPVP